MILDVSIGTIRSRLSHEGEIRSFNSSGKSYRLSYDVRDKSKRCNCCKRSEI
jgi:hypothetical protein